MRDAGGGVITLETVPVVQTVELRAPAMVEYAEALAATGGGSTLPPPAAFRVLASKACRRAVMFGDELSRDECQAILTNLAACDFPFQCAHGRPTVAPAVDMEVLPAPPG